MLNALRCAIAQMGVVFSEALMDVIVLGELYSKCGLGGATLSISSKARSIARADRANMGSCSSRSMCALYASLVLSR
jgi:hypothetical protein